MSIPDPRCDKEMDLVRAAILLDCLIPGDVKRWPIFSVAVPVSDLWEALDEHQRADLLNWSQALDHLAPEDRFEAIKAVEQTQTHRFSRLLSVVYRAYYTAPAVLEMIRILADSGPREPLPLFDPSLVQRVLATRAGQRRL